MLSRPEKGEYVEYYHDYVRRVPEGSVVDVLRAQMKQVVELGQMSDEEAARPTAPGKWSVKQVIGHLSDCERNMGFRAYRFARADKAELPGWEQDDYIASGRYNERPLRELLSEYEVLRRGNIALFSSLTPEEATRTGVANKNAVSVRALAYIMAGHEHRHLEIIREARGK